MGEINSVNVLVVLDSIVLVLMMNNLPGKLNESRLLSFYSPELKHPELKYLLTSIKNTLSKGQYKITSLIDLNYCIVSITWCPIQCSKPVLAESHMCFI